MKILIALAVLFLTAVPKKCATEEEETEVTNLPHETGYTAEDTQLRKAYADWVEFCKEADSIILDARVQISEATDCYNDSRTKSRSKLKSAIIKSELKLEKLSDKMLQRTKFSEERFQTDPAVLQEVTNFKIDLGRKQEELNKALLEMKKLY